MAFLHFSNQTLGKIEKNKPKQNKPKNHQRNPKPKIQVCILEAKTSRQVKCVDAMRDHQERRDTAAILIRQFKEKASWEVVHVRCC